MPADFDIKKPRQASSPAAQFRPPQPPRDQPTGLPKRPPQTAPARGGGIVPKSQKKYGHRGTRTKPGRNYWRIASQLAFALALLAILGVIVRLTVMPDAQQANNYAMYAFFLLLAATVSLAFESRDK